MRRSYLALMVVLGILLVAPLLTDDARGLAVVLVLLASVSGDIAVSHGWKVAWHP